MAQTYLRMFWLVHVCACFVFFFHFLFPTSRSFSVGFPSFSSRFFSFVINFCKLFVWHDRSSFIRFMSISRHSGIARQAMPKPNRRQDCNKNQDDSTTLNRDYPSHAQVPKSCSCFPPIKTLPELQVFRTREALQGF